MCVSRAAERPATDVSWRMAVLVGVCCKRLHALHFVALKDKRVWVASWPCRGAVGMYLRGVFVWWSASSACLVCCRTDEGAPCAKAARGANYVWGCGVAQLV